MKAGQNPIDKLVVETVRALSDDNAVEAVIGIMSGGLIVAGLVGGPAIVATATVASTLMQISDMRNKLNAKVKMAKQDHDTARVEIALVLIRYAHDLSDHWLKIL